jgi:hypothetical protein
LTLQQRIELLSELGNYLGNAGGDERLNAVIHQAYMENRWFTPENIQFALKSIAQQMLDSDRLKAWATTYPIHSSLHPEHTIGIVMAGNIPLVGFHDWLCVFVAGERAKIKMSEKDKTLLPFLIALLGEWSHESREYTIFCGEHEPLRDFDAVIATGSNNTARYFEQYFAAYPHIIRRNRNAVAILDGTETMADFYALGHDIFTFFGLGCRNVSKIYVPQNYNFEPLLEGLHEYKELANHDKYRNNFDYNTTLYIMNNIPYMNNGCVILREDPALSSRISSIHYEYYSDLAALTVKTDQQREEIQCVVSKIQLPSIETLPLGQTQSPALSDYPDGVDVMLWLTNLK